MKADTKTCPRCKKNLPIFKEDGTHNFCPHILEGSAVTDICIGCKSDLMNSKSKEMESCTPVH